MPKPLYALTDGYYEEPIAQPLPVDIPRVVISGNVGTDNIVRPAPDYVNPPQGNAVAKLTGNEGERYQLWPEKIIRDGLKAAGEVLSKGAINPGLRREDYTDIPAPDMPTKDSTALGKALNIAPVAWDPQDKIIEDAQAISALAGSGGLAGVTDATLGATPFLRPALRYKDKLYKGKEGQQHLDVIPEQLYPDFQKKAMSGEDIKDYNFGFINDKGQFLTREKALEYGINTGLIDPQAGKYGALTSTLMADSSKPGTAIEAVGKMGGADPRHFQSVEAAKFRLGQLQRDKAHTKKAGEDVNSSDYMFYNTQIRALKNYIKDPETFLKADSSKEGAALQANKPMFYSAVEHNVNAIPQSKMTGDQWLGTLANKPGVKGEELDWTGLKGFLEEHKGKPVTKEQIQEHLASNKVELKEVGKGEEFNTARKAKAQELMAKLSELEKDNIAKGTFKNTPEMEKIQNELQAVREQSQAVTTKYQSYQLPGAENYREMLLTLPAKKSQEAILKEAQLRAKEGHYPNTEWKDIPEPMRKDYLATAERTQDKNYKSSHWDEPNILAHVRMNDRTIDGKKSLHVEEIQSDLHQDGRKHGYKNDAERVSKELANTIATKIKDGFAAENISQGDILKAFKSKKISEKEKDDILEYQNKFMGISGSVPDMPFKKNWDELALKRIMREAAEKNYDRISWTSGEAHPTNPKNLKQSGPDADKADKGMRGFYNDILPKTVEKLGKQYGVKVKTHELDIAGEKKKIFYIDVPQGLKDTALNKGFPLFSNGYMLVPVQGNPFSDNK